VPKADIGLVLRDERFIVLEEMFFDALAVEQIAFLIVAQLDQPAIPLDGSSACRIIKTVSAAGFSVLPSGKWPGKVYLSLTRAVTNPGF
jgi:hypothetical protein